MPLDESKLALDTFAVPVGQVPPPTYNCSRRFYLPDDFLCFE